MSVDKFGRHSSGQIYMEPGVSLRFVSNSFLRRDGSNDVIGDISLNNNKITNLQDPINAQDASTKNYTDTKMSKSGDAMSGTLDMNNNRISNLVEPVDGGDAATRSYVKAFARNNFLKLDGSNSATRDISFNNNRITNLANPVEGGDGVNKQYVDARKPLITIWAQRTGTLNTRSYEWSFGNGRTPQRGGYCSPIAGRILRGGVTYISDRVLLSANRPDFIRIADVMIDGTKRCEIDVIYGNTNSHSSFPAVGFAAGSVINFQTASTDLRAISTTISLIIELTF